MGLPGSGKSTFVKHELKNNYLHGYNIDLDSMMPKTHEDIELTIIEKLKTKNIINKGNYWNRETTPSIYIDGLITTNDILKDVIKACVKYIASYTKKIKINFFIHYWTEDRDNCNNNDMLRFKIGKRNESSAISIKHMEFETVNDSIVEEINSYAFCSCKVVNHKVPELTMRDIIIENFSNDRNHTMISDTWSGGGSWANCWGNSGTISAENTPEFAMFDDMLTQICPNITFLQYKKLYAETVSTHREEEYDYYGGSETKFNYECDLDKMCDMLTTMYLI